MKRLKFKKWVSYTIAIILLLAMFILCSVRPESLIHEVILDTVCLLIIYVNSILLGIFG